MIKSANKQDLITVVGVNFLNFVIWDLVQQSYLTYMQTDFTKKRFQTAMWEHSHAAAAIVLSVIGIEAYRNRICALKNIKIIDRKDRKKVVPAHICEILRKESVGFPDQLLKNILTEVFIIRDVITHNHVYEVTITSDEKWNVLHHRQKLLGEGGYGDSKHKAHVNMRTKKTNLLKLNVQPAKIGFEDIFKVLVVTDLLIRIMQTVLGAGYVPFHVTCEIGNRPANNMSEILTHYYGQIKRRSFLKFLEELAAQFRNDFSSFLPPYPHSNCFITNTCPQCSKLGFDRIGDASYCGKCGLHMGGNSNGVYCIEFVNKVDRNIEAG